MIVLEVLHHIITFLMGFFPYSVRDWLLSNQSIRVNAITSIVQK